MRSTQEQGRRAHRVGQGAAQGHRSIALANLQGGGTRAGIVKAHQHGPAIVQGDLRAGLAGGIASNRADHRALRAQHMQELSVKQITTKATQQSGL
jgi:hypothetical protein